MKREIISWGIFLAGLWITSFADNIANMLTHNDKGSINVCIGIAIIFVGCAVMLSSLRYPTSKEVASGPEKKEASKISTPNKIMLIASVLLGISIGLWLAFKSIF